MSSRAETPAARVSSDHLNILMLREHVHADVEIRLPAPVAQRCDLIGNGATVEHGPHGDPLGLIRWQLLAEAEVRGS